MTINYAQAELPSSPSRIKIDTRQLTIMRCQKTGNREHHKTLHFPSIKVFESCVKDILNKDWDSEIYVNGGRIQ